MSSRREFLIGAAAAAGALPFQTGGVSSPQRACEDDLDVTSLDVTGYGAENNGVDRLGVEEVTDVEQFDLRTSGETNTLLVDVDTTAGVGVRIAGDVTHDQLEQLRADLDDALGEA